MKRRHPARSHIIVQFNAPPTAQQLQSLEQRGAKVLRPVPDQGVLVSAPDDMSFSDLDLYRLHALTAEQKISHLLQLWVSEEARIRFLVEFHPDVNQGEAREIVLQEGFEIREHPDLLPEQLLIEGEQAQLLHLAAWDEVAYLFPASRELQEGVPVVPCAGAVTSNGTVGQYVATVGPGWDGPGQNAADLTYYYERLTEQLPRDVAAAEIERALLEWANYVQVHFRQGDSPVAHRNLNILFASGHHGDPYPFDGPSRVLAHTFYPAPPNPEPIAGDLHFDDDENWQVGARLDVFSVALHELGHALGLGHVDDPNAVMYPYYRQVSGLSEVDIAGIRQLYAAADDSQPPVPPVPPLQLLIEHPGPTVTTEAESISISGTASGGEGELQVTWMSDRGPSGSASGSDSWTIPAAPLTTGANVITVTATDSSGASVSRSVTVHREAEQQSPPVVLITWPSPNQVYRTAETSIVISGRAYHESGIVSVSWSTSAGESGGTHGTSYWSAGPIPLVEGSNVITVTAEARNGGTASESVQVHYEQPGAPEPPEDPPEPPQPNPDAGPPSLTIFEPAGTNVLTRQPSIIFRGIARDNVGISKVTWSCTTTGSGVASGTGYWRTGDIPLLIGTNVITIRAFDAAGNSTWRSATVTRR